MRLVQHSSDYGKWELPLRESAPRLQGLVGEYQGYREFSARPVRRRELPPGDIPLIIGFDAPFRLLDPDDPRRILDEPRSFLTGLHECYAISESVGYAYFMQINFTPLGAHLLLDIHCREIKQGIVERPYGPREYAIRGPQGDIWHIRIYRPECSSLSDRCAIHPE